MANEAGPAATPATEAAVTAEPTDRVALADYKSNGKTKVRARVGYQVVPTDKSLPVIDEHGINVTQEQANRLFGEAEEYLELVEAEKE